MISSSELQTLVKAGLISLEQSHAIVSFQSSQKSSGGGFSHSIMTIGAILIGLGVLSLVALNREGMSDILKITTLLSSMTISYMLGWYFKHQKKSLLGGTLLFLSGLLCGTSIFLIAQIYNLTWTNDVLLGIWIVMILPLVYLLRQKEFYWLYMILLSCVLGQFLMSHMFQTVDERTTFVLYTIFGFLMILLGYVHDIYYDDTQLNKLYKIFGANIAMIAFFIIIVMSGDGFIESARFLFSSSLSAIIVGLLMAYLLFYFFKRQQELLYAMIAFIIMICTIALIDSIIVAYVVFILLCLVLIYLGYQNTNNGLIKIANVYLYLFLLYLYGKYGREYENKALFFILGGVLMIGLGLGFSKLNKMIGNVLVSNKSLDDN